jgi:hypothetical protein
MRQHEEPRIYVDSEGRRQGTMAKSERPEDMLCDFCSEVHVQFKVYNCKDFDAGLGIMSRGKWNACLKCAELIDANDREGLALRSTIMLADESKHDCMDTMRELHAKFFANRIV